MFKRSVDKILKESLLSEDKLKNLEKKIKTQISEIEEFATTALLPDESELYTDIFK